MIIEKLKQFSFDYGTFQLTLHPFIAKYIFGEIILTEHHDFKWLSKHELHSLDWALADIPVLNYFLSHYYDSARTI